jgi:hypothetical protein
MQQSMDESFVTREVPSGWGPFRFLATSRLWLRKADGTSREIIFADHSGATADEAEAKARKAVDAWKTQVDAWKWRGRQRQRHK